MSKRLAVKIIIDIIMTILMLLAIGCQLTGVRAHEYIGAALFALFIVHNLLNWRWYGGLARGKYSARRIISSAVNLLLAVDMLLLAATSVMISRELRPLLHIDSGFLARQIHTLTAYWGLLLMSVHIGLHWEMLLGMAKKLSGRSGEARALTASMRAVTLLIILWGIKSSFTLDVGDKLTMRATFSFWPFDESKAGFFAAWLSVMAVYISAAYYAVRVLSGSKNL